MMIQDKMNNSDNHTENVITFCRTCNTRSFYALFLFCKNLPGDLIGPFKKPYKAQKPFKVKDIKMCLI